MNNSSGGQSNSFSTSAIQAAPFVPGVHEKSGSSVAKGQKVAPQKTAFPSLPPPALDTSKSKADVSTSGRGNARRSAGTSNVRGNGRQRTRQPAAPPPALTPSRGNRNGHTTTRNAPPPPPGPGAAPGSTPPFPPPPGVPMNAPLGPVPPSVPPPASPLRHTKFQAPPHHVNNLLMHIPDRTQMHIIQPGQAYAARQFISDAVRGELTQQAYLRMAQVNTSVDGNMGLPDMLHGYHTLYPLEDIATSDEQPSPAFGLCTFILKGTSTKTGDTHALRRIDGRQLEPSAELLQEARKVSERWQTISMHPNIVALRDVFVADDGDGVSSLHFAHDYIPGSITAAHLHLLPSQSQSGLVINAPSAAQLWSYATQLTAAARAAHAAGLVLGAACLMPTKVLVSPSSGRIRITACGTVEAMHSVKFDNVALAQREDMQHLGRLLLALACASSNANMLSVEHVATHHSPDLARMIGSLLNMARDGLSWQGLTSSLGDSMLGQLDAAYATNDALLSDLSQEMENGRLLRLLMKLNMIVDKPVLDRDPQWSETGDRYLLKLFRDFIFHQVNEQGAPSVSWGHIVEALNKLDVGSADKIILLSRNEIDMLITTYADMKRCLEACYQEILRAAGPPVNTHSVRSQVSRQQTYFR